MFIHRLNKVLKTRNFIWSGGKRIILNLPSEGWLTFFSPAVSDSRSFLTLRIVLTLPLEFLSHKTTKFLFYSHKKQQNLVQPNCKLVNKAITSKSPQTVQLCASYFDITLSCKDTGWNRFSLCKRTDFNSVLSSQWTVSISTCHILYQIHPLHCKYCYVNYTIFFKIKFWNSSWRLRKKHILMLAERDSSLSAVTSKTPPVLWTF